MIHLSRSLAVAFGLTLAVIGAASAQPANVPQDAGTRFVDEDGCAWQRLDIGGETAWAAVIGPDREQVCEPVTDPVAVPTETVAAKSKRVQRDPKFPAVGYHIQVGAFREAENAERTILRLQAANLNALRQSFVRTDRALQIIYAGPFPTAESAAMARAQIRAMGYGDAFVWEP